MSAIEEEITSYINKCFSKLKIYNNINVSYIKTLSGQDAITLICGEDKNSKRDNKINNKPSSVLNENGTRKEDDSLNLTGTPLEDICYMDNLSNIDDLDTVDINKLTKNPQWKYEEQNFIPIDLNKSNTIMSHIMVKFIKTKNNKESIWILCDRNNNNNNNRNTVLLNIKCENLFNDRSIVFYNGIKLADDLDMSEMMKIHLNYIGKKVKVHTKVECTFNVSPYAYLNVNWNSSSSIKLPLNDFKNSDVTLFHSIEIGKCSSSTKELWTQIIALINLKMSILDFDNTAETINNFYFKNVEIYLDIDSIRENILSLLTDVSSEFQKREINTTNSEFEEIIDNVNNRSDLDIIDQLWNILKHCSNYQDLKSAISYIFFCAAKYNVVNLPTKETRLGELMREVAHHRIAIPCLVGSEPMELLLEIGIHKIYKDYQYIFLKSKIYSPNRLGTKYFNKSNDLKFDNDLKTNIQTNDNNGNMDKRSLKKKSLFHNFDKKYDTEIENIEGFECSKFDENDVNNKLSRLIQIHLTLEHLILIQNNLNLENLYTLICENILRKHPKSFSTILNSVIDKIEIPVTFDYVFCVLNQKIPQMRKITMNSGNSFKQIQNVFYFNEEMIIPEQNLTETIKIDVKEFKNKNFYHYWQYQTIRTRRC